MEFLIGKMGAGAESSLETNIGVSAQSLWHMDILSRNTVEVSYLGMTLLVPSPEAYAVHKMVINKERKGNAEAARIIWPHLNMDEIDRIRRSLTKKEDAAVCVFMKEVLGF